MDINTITQVVGSLGFPIAACVALFVRLVKSDEIHKEELTKMSDALNNNTQVLTELATLLKEMKS